MVAIQNATVFVSLLIQIILVDFINGGTKKGIESIETNANLAINIWFLPVYIKHFFEQAFQCIILFN